MDLRYDLENKLTEMSYRLASYRAAAEAIPQLEADIEAIKALFESADKGEVVAIPVAKREADTKLEPAEPITKELTR